MTQSINHQMTHRVTGSSPIFDRWSTKWTGTQTKAVSTSSWKERAKKKMWHDSNKLKIARPIDQADDITRLQLFFFFDESINRRQCELLSKPSERRVFFFYFFNDPFVVCSGCSIPAEFFFFSASFRSAQGAERTGTREWRCYSWPTRTQA